MPYWTRVLDPDETIVTVSTCPTMIARAPADAVWSRLQDPPSYGQWMDAHLVSVTPPTAAVAGQRILLRAPKWGRFFAVRITVDAVEAANRALVLHGQFPFGFQLRNRITVIAIDDRTSRVAFG